MPDDLLLSIFFSFSRFGRPPATRRPRVQVQHRSVFVPGNTPPIRSPRACCCYTARSNSARGQHGHSPTSPVLSSRCRGVSGFFLFLPRQAPSVSTSTSAPDLPALKPASSICRMAPCSAPRGRQGNTARAQLNQTRLCSWSLVTTKKLTTNAQHLLHRAAGAEDRAGQVAAELSSLWALASLLSASKIAK